MGKLSEKNRANINKVACKSDYKVCTEFGVNIRIYFDNIHRIQTNKKRNIMEEMYNPLMHSGMIYCKPADEDADIADFAYNIFHFKDYNMLLNEMLPSIKKLKRFVNDNQDYDYYKSYSIKDKETVKHIIEHFTRFEKPYVYSVYRDYISDDKDISVPSTQIFYTKEIENVLSGKANLYRLYVFLNNLSKYENIDFECYFYIIKSH